MPSLENPYANTSSTFELVQCTKHRQHTNITHTHTHIKCTHARTHQLTILTKLVVRSHEWWVRGDNFIVMQRSVEEIFAGLYVKSHHVGTTTVPAMTDFYHNRSTKLIKFITICCWYLFSLLCTVLNKGPMVLWPQVAQHTVNFPL